MYSKLDIQTQESVEFHRDGLLVKLPGMGVRAAWQHNLREFLCSIFAEFALLSDFSGMQDQLAIPISMESIRKPAFSTCKILAWMFDLIIFDVALVLLQS